MIQRETSSSHARRRPDEPVGPVRTCVGCRRRELAVELLRVAAVHDGNGGCAVTVDTAGNLPGRGAWLHPDQQCLRDAIRRRAFARALRITGTPDTSAVVEWFGMLQGSSRDHEAEAAREKVAKNMSTP